MRRVLREIRDGYGPFLGVRTRLAFVARDRTIAALQRLKLVDGHMVLTLHGRDALLRAGRNAANG
jgi:hypothetical protein